MAVEEYTCGGRSFRLETRPGVFAQYGLDKGSKLLLEVVRFPQRGTILDLGCGCGFLGLVAAGVSPESQVHLVDSDIRAVNLSQHNAELNELANVVVTLSDGITNLPKDLKFDLVLSNPPTHQGREVVLQFIRDAYQVSKRGGVAYFVVNRLTSVFRKLEGEFGNAEKVVRRDGYIVFRAAKLTCASV